MEKSTKALLALALLFTAFIASIEGGRDVPEKEEADGGSPLHTLTFGLLFPWWWGSKGGGGAQAAETVGGVVVLEASSLGLLGILGSQGILGSVVMVEGPLPL